MATSLTSHRSSRATAGAAYAAAAQAYVDAYIELAAYDGTVSNTVLGGSMALGFGELPRIAGHGEFLRNIPAVVGDVPGRIATRRTTLIAS